MKMRIVNNVQNRDVAAGKRAKMELLYSHDLL